MLEFDAALNQFLQIRAAHISELEALTPQYWERIGTHEEVGAITILGQMIHIVCHDAIHLAQMARQVAKVRQSME